METRRFYVITGGTMVHVSPHFALTSPAYGRVGEQIADELYNLFTPNDAAEFEPGWTDVCLVRTRMACGTEGHNAEEKELFANAGIKFLETNEDLEKLIDYLVLMPDTKGIVMAAAVFDWKPLEVRALSGVGEEFSTSFGKREPRLQTAVGRHQLTLAPADKIIGKIRRERKDIFLVGFKATTGKTEQEQYITGLGLLKGSSCNLVLANDVHEHRNMVITPEEAKYHVTKDRKKAIRGLCEMIAMRSQLHFTRSTVIPGEPIPWDSDAVPESLRKVVDHCIKRGAYKPFQGKTVGHFATRGPEPGVIYTSRRKSNFNDLAQDGLLRIDAVGDDQVIAHGAKPSVGGQSQRIIFERKPWVDCIVHFHCPRKAVDRPKWSAPGVREQRPYECGSHECGQNTCDGLRNVAGADGHGISAVFLEEHGPNICFPADIDPDLVIEYIEEHFDLAAKTGGPVSLETA